MTIIKNVKRGTGRKSTSPRYKTMKSDIYNFLQKNVLVNFKQGRAYQF